MSHHENIKIGDKFVGHVRITNDGEILSIWISGQKMLFIPEEVDVGRRI
jgi:hypothetical protein